MAGEAVIPSPPAEPLSHVDRAWLRMDDPTNLMMIAGVLVFDRPLTTPEVKAVVGERLLPISRFRQRVVGLGTGGRARWEAAPDLDLDEHVTETALPAPGDDRVLREAVSKLMSTPLDRRRPLWCFHLLQGYRGGSVLMGRIHHCIGDGIALMLVLLSLAELPDEAGGSEPGESVRCGNPFRTLFQGPGADLEGARRGAERIMPEGMKLLLQPAEMLRATSRWLTGAAAMGALGRLTFRSADPATPFRGPLGVAKRAAWSDPVPLEEVQAVRQALGGSLTDVLLTAMTGGLRRYLEGRGRLAPDLSFRAAVPVNLRPLEEMAELGNRFGLVFLDLPVGIGDPVARLAELGRRMRALRRSAEPVVAFGILKALGRSPLAVQRAVVRLIGLKATAVMTSVPGPREVLYLAGKPIREIFFWVPQAGRLGLGISILSYAGNARLGVGTDAGLVPDPEAIVEGFHEEFAAMRRLAGD